MTNKNRDRLGALSEHEKERIRANVREFMREHPARAPFSIRTLDGLSLAGAWLGTKVFSPRLQFGAATVAFVLVAGSGTAFAAQSALPGDPLYGVKVNIEEPITGAFATSASAQADWNAQLAARRLSEAEQLAAQNKLTASAASTIASGLDQATENFDTNIAQVATSSSNATTVAALESNMEATLAANTQVLSEIENAVPASASTLAPIISSAQERAVALNSARTQFDTAAARTNVAQVKVAAQEQLDAVVGQLNDVALNATSTTQGSATPQAQAAEESIQAGQENLNQGNYVAALETLQAAGVEAHEAQLNVTVGEELHQSTGIELPATTSSSTFSVTIGSVATSSVASSTPATSTSSTSTVRSRRDRDAELTF